MPLVAIAAERQIDIKESATRLVMQNHYCPPNNEGGCIFRIKHELSIHKYTLCVSHFLGDACCSLSVCSGE